MTWGHRRRRLPLFLCCRRVDTRAVQPARLTKRKAVANGRGQMLTRGDDYPIHQTPEPIAYAGSDRNFYDRYFFNG